MITRFEHSVVRELQARRGWLDQQAVSLGHAVKSYISSCMERLNSLDTKARLLDPRNVLRRGYSITTLGGRALTDTSRLGKGDIITTRLYRGAVTSSVETLEEGTILDEGTLNEGTTEEDTEDGVQEKDG
jgi:exodeoxyribonuclease VII large subunit